jgi:hypothetical protein
MPHMIFATKNYETDEIVKSEGNQELSFFVDHLRNAIWAIDIPSWLSAVSGRLIAISADSYISRSVDC